MKYEVCEIKKLHPRRSAAVKRDCLCFYISRNLRSAICVSQFGARYNKYLVGTAEDESLNLSVI